LWPWSIDAWSFGVVLLEMVVGFPVWLSLKGRKTRGSKSSETMKGVFGVQGRLIVKIATIQRELDVKHYLSRQVLCLGNLNNDESFINLLS
jgi:hypothetical protein